MRKTFSGYYRPSEEEFADLWKNCLFVLDANVLLNLYRYSEQTREALIGILEKIVDRLWIPHQVALEYQDNRLSTIAEQARRYDRISETLQDARQQLQDLLGREHPSLDVDSLRAKVQAVFSDLESELNGQRQQHPDLAESDHIRDTLTVVLEGKVGSPYSQECLAEIYKSAQDRYDNIVPPGYRDSKKETVKRYGSLVLRDRYGDLVLWRQVIDQAKEEQRPIIFVTDDTKEDWWWTSQGKTIGPRPELVTEMMCEANVSFYMYNSNRFMTFAREYLEVEVAQEAVDEVQEIIEETGLWRDEIVQALRALGGEARLSEIYDYIERTTQRELPGTWQATVRYYLQLHSSDTETFKGGRDLFRHLGRGYWGLRMEHAARFAEELRRLARHQGQRQSVQYVYLTQGGETLIHEASDTQGQDPIVQCSSQNVVQLWLEDGYVKLVLEANWPNTFLLTDKALRELGTERS